MAKIVEKTDETPVESTKIVKTDMQLLAEAIRDMIPSTSKIESPETIKDIVPENPDIIPIEKDWLEYRVRDGASVKYGYGPQSKWGVKPGGSIIKLPKKDYEKRKEFLIPVKGEK